MEMHSAVICDDKNKAKPSFLIRVSKDKVAEWARKWSLERSVRPSEGARQQIKCALRLTLTLTLTLTIVLMDYEKARSWDGAHGLCALIDCSGLSHSLPRLV